MKTVERAVQLLPGERNLTRAMGPGHSFILTNCRIIQQRSGRGGAESTSFFLENMDSVETTTKTRPNLLIGAIGCFGMAVLFAILGDMNKDLAAIAVTLAIFSFALLIAYIALRTRVVAFHSQRSDIHIHSKGRAIQSVPRFVELVERAKNERMLMLAGLVEVEYEEPESS